MRVLITGGAGYIGSRLIQWMLPNKHFTQITVIDNFMWHQQHVLNSFYNHPYRATKFDVIADDISKMNLKLVKGYDAVVHLAAIVGASACDKDPERTHQTNVVAVKRLLVSGGMDKRFIYPNTNSGYGTSNEEICTEESPLEPVSLYGKTKCEGEKLVTGYAKNHMVFRLATVFGLSPRMRYDLMVNDFVRRLYFDRYLEIFEPHYRRNFVHIDDVCRAIIFALGTKHTGIFNLGNDDLNCTKMGLAQQIVSQLNHPASIITGEGKDPDQRDYNVSSDKIRQLGFECRYSLNDGIKDLLSHYSLYREAGDVFYVDMQNSVSR